MTTVAVQLKAAGVELDGQAPVLIRWSVRCRTEPCRFALLHLRSQARARRAAAEHAEIHAGHEPTVYADARVPVRAGTTAGRLRARVAHAGIPETDLHGEEVSR